MPNLIHCLYCGKETPQTKKSKKFCSTTCRVYWHLKNKELKCDAKISKIKKIIEE